MASREIVLWLDERWYDALERHIKDETLQDKMENYLDELCNNLLPDYEYEQISREIYEERVAQAEQREADRRFAVFHVTERGEQSFFLVDEPIELVNAARSMRTYVRSDDPALGFRSYYAAAQAASDKPGHAGTWPYPRQRCNRSGSPCPTSANW